MAAWDDRKTWRARKATQERMEQLAPDGLSSFDRERIGDIIAGLGSWFHADLLRLCAHADPGNLERLRKGFPETVKAYIEWRES